MNEHTSTSNHAYVIAHGMSRAPFDNNIEDDLFYAEPTRKQKLDILLHLAQYGNELMLVTGPTASGKTTLLQQFKLHALDTWKVARIEAKNGIDERKLVQQLFHQMDLEFHGATHTELLEHLEHHFDSLHHSARQAIMLLDDADKLPVTALKAILSLAGLTSKDNKPLLRIVLFGDNQLNENISDPLLAQYNNIVKRNIELPAFEKEQTTHYILHRLSAANFANNKPFTEAAMQKIHKQSNGWPGEINKLAHALLVETAPTETNSTKTNISIPFNTPHAIAAAVGITIISALLFFQDEFNHWLDDSAEIKSNINLPLALPTEEKPAARPEASSHNAEAPTASTASTVNPVDLSPQQLPSNNPAATLAQIDEGEKSTNELNTAIKAVDEIPDSETAPNFSTSAKTASEQPIQTTEPANKPVALSENKPVAKPTVEPIPPTTATKKTSKPATVSNLAKAKTKSVPTDLPGHRTDWILKQNSEHFTLQLVAGNNIKTLRAFINRYPLSAPLAVYRSTRKNKPWFALIHGIYASKQQAIDARSRLSHKLRRTKPWVRELAPLQAQLRHTAQ